MTDRTHLETTLSAAVWKWQPEEVGAVMALVIAGFTGTGVVLLRIILLLPAD